MVICILVSHNNCYDDNIISFVIYRTINIITERSEGACAPARPPPPNDAYDFYKFLCAAQHVATPINILNFRWDNFCDQKSNYEIHGILYHENLKLYGIYYMHTWLPSKLTSIVDSNSSAPNSDSVANVVPGNAVVVHSLPTGILSLSDVRNYETAFSIYHGFRELLITSEPGIGQSKKWSINGTR